MSGQKTIELAILGMNCEGCVKSVREALCEVDGVIDATVDLEEALAEVTLDEDADVPVETLIEAVRDAGYDAAVSP
jgi:copper chaperone CopZ